MASANGRLLASELALIPGTNEYIRKDLLPQLVALMRAFKAHFGRDLKITDGYRSYDEQVAIKKAKPYLAGTPGTSKHGLGIAVDLGSGVQASFTSPEHLWLRANGPAFGLFIPAWAQAGGSKPEQWHWEFSTGVVPVANYKHIPGAVPSTPDIPGIDPIMEDSMSAAGEAAILAGIANVEALLAVERNGGIRADVLGFREAFDAQAAQITAVAQNIENIIARDGDGGIRGEVYKVRPDINTVATELRAMRGVLDAINSRDAAVVAGAIPEDIAQAVVDLLQRRLES